MFAFHSRYAIPLAAMLIWLAPVRATDLDPKALTYKLPSQITWVENKTAGNAIAVLAGDPNKPGLYVILEKWYAHHNSRPHFHPNDRFITVISGTWWVNTGPKYDPDGMVPLPTGTFVTHFGKEIHYDGAKEAECVIEIAGEGPAQYASRAALRIFCTLPVGCITRVHDKKGCPPPVCNLPADYVYCASGGLSRI